MSQGVSPKGKHAFRTTCADDAKSRCSVAESGFGRQPHIRCSTMFHFASLLYENYLYFKSPNSHQPRTLRHQKFHERSEVKFRRNVAHMRSPPLADLGGGFRRKPQPHVGCCAMCMFSFCLPSRQAAQKRISFCFFRFGFGAEGQG